MVDETVAKPNFEETLNYLENKLSRSEEWADSRQKALDLEREENRNLKQKLRDAEHAYSMWQFYAYSGFTLSVFFLGLAIAAIW